MARTLVRLVIARAPRRSLAALVGVVVLARAPVAAYARPPKTAPLVTSPSPSPSPSPQDLARARALDKEGARAYGEGRYADAIRSFEEAYRLGGPAFELWNIAKCHLRLDQPALAAAQLERYLATSELPREDRDEATRQLELLRKRPSTVRVTSTPSGAEVTVDGASRPAGRTPLRVTVQPGAHALTLTAPSRRPLTRQIEARYGQALEVDASLEIEDRRPPPPPNPYDTSRLEGPISLRAGFGVVFTRHGDIGGASSAGLTAQGTYRLASVGAARIAVGALVTGSRDAWDNRTGQPNTAPDCAAPLEDAQSATALSIFGLGTVSYPMGRRARMVGLGGVGLASYLTSDLGGDLFLPTCHASPGARPSMLLGLQLDFALTSAVRISATPITWQLQPAFSGTRAEPRDAGGPWMRFGVGLGAGVDL